METSSVEALVRRLNANGVRYLIAGGLAVVAHGYVRFTADVDLVIDLAPMNVSEALRSLAELDYRPRAPVALSEFADPANRAKWVREKGLTVFSLFRAGRPQDLLDVEKLSASRAGSADK